MGSCGISSIFLAGEGETGHSSRSDPGDLVHRKAAAIRVLPNDLHVVRVVDAVDLVVGDVAMHPLDFGT